MRDFERLRMQLRVAVFGLAAACGPPGKGASGPAAGAAPDGGSGGGDGRAGVMSTPAQNCTQGQWCGPSDKPRKFATGGGDDRLGCPSDAADPDGTMFKLNDADTAKAREAGQADACCYDFVAACWDNQVIEGRALVGEHGEARVAPVAASAGTDAQAQWLEAALTEHASVASFARATLELMALGAPLELLRDVQRAALDEVRHAESAFTLAGTEARPGRLEAVHARGLDLAGLAVATFAEGCVGETVALLRAERRLAAGGDDEDERRHLEMLVRDEARHVALAWRTVMWCLAQDGPAVRAALLAAAARMAPPERAGAVGRDAWYGVIEPMLREAIGQA